MTPPFEETEGGESSGHDFAGRFAVDVTPSRVASARMGADRGDLRQANIRSSHTKKSDAGARLTSG
ncbi:MAG: hypothetical protein IT578_04575 [Verrucomicrobiae bacterium]|nr:hypothetical protein [Verrucomicrobiae bacterium]